MSRMITHPAFLLDQMGDPVRRPQTGFIPQCLRPAFEPDLDLAELPRTQSRSASGAASLLQPGTPFGRQLGCPLRAEPVGSGAAGGCAPAVSE